ncbi:MAG: DegV family protein [Chloroflexi bacterium]|nr:DegV family protein [Chloroflexota bacterium]
MIKIVTDSTCNLSPEVIRRHDLRIAPITIQFGTQSYQEGIDIDRALFYRTIEERQIIPSTSQPTPAWFARFFEELHAQGHEILVITVTGEHSGTYSSAMLAQSMVPQAAVEVFDSRSISLGTGWMVLEAARMAESGSGREAILARLAHIRDRGQLFLTPATLKYLQMSGRVGKLQGAIASLLNVKPIIALKGGQLDARENVRTRSRALERLLELLGEALGTQVPLNMAVIHAEVREEALALATRVRTEFNVRELLIEDLVPSLAVHGGPGVIGVFGYPVS